MFNNEFSSICIARQKTGTNFMKWHFISRATPWPFSLQHSRSTGGDAHVQKGEQHSSLCFLKLPECPFHYPSKPMGQTRAVVRQEATLQSEVHRQSKVTKEQKLLGHLSRGALPFKILLSPSHPGGEQLLKYSWYIKNKSYQVQFIIKGTPII